MLGGAGPAAKPRSSRKSPVLLGLLWVAAECLVWGRSPKSPLGTGVGEVAVLGQSGAVEWCGGTGTWGPPGGHPGLVMALGEQGPGWGSLVWAKIRVGHLRTSSGRGPWAEPRALWAPQRYQARAWPGGATQRPSTPGLGKWVPSGRQVGSQGALRPRWGAVGSRAGLRL